MNNPRSEINRRGDYEKTWVKKGATIGANATIICGITLGEYAFIGAGSVVTKDVAPYALVVGNPSKQIGWMSAYGERLEFNAEGIALCTATGDNYKLENSSVKKI